MWNFNFVHITQLSSQKLISKKFKWFLGYNGNFSVSRHSSSQLWLIQISTKIDQRKILYKQIIDKITVHWSTRYYILSSLILQQPYKESILTPAVLMKKPSRSPLIQGHTTSTSQGWYSNLGSPSTWTTSYNVTCKLDILITPYLPLSIPNPSFWLNDKVPKMLSNIYAIVWNAGRHWPTLVSSVVGVAPLLV